VLVTTVLKEKDGTEVVRGFRMPEAPHDYPFTLTQVLDFDLEQVIYEVHLARIGRIRHYTDPEYVKRYVEVIDWLLMVRPELIGDPRTWQKINPADYDN
jgi:hypothetical protein